MSALNGLEQVNEILALCGVLALLVALAVAFAPQRPPRRIPAMAKRMRDTGRY